MELNHNEQTIQQVQHIHKLIERRIGQSAMRRSLQPLWYRGLSNSQLAGAHGLKLAINDDIFQGSAHRTYRQLCQLGLSPRPPRSVLRLLLQMSQGNEVAFLWFLMEMFYKTDDHKIMYEFNEQIIMSAIFWLDLYPTLSELDRVLPLPHASAEDRLKEEEAEAFQLRQEQKSLKRKPSQLPISPYFQKPVVIYPSQQRLHAFSPKEAVKLPQPEVNPDESLWSRWFCDFEFNSSENVVQCLLNKEFNNIMSSMEAANLSPCQVDAMCASHKQIRSMEQSLQWNLEAIKQEQRKRLLDLSYPKQEKKRRLALEHLDRLTEKYQEQFHKMAVKARVSTMRINLRADPLDPGFIYLGDCKSDEELAEFVDNSRTCFKLLKGHDPWVVSSPERKKRQSSPLLKQKKLSRPVQPLPDGATEMEEETESTLQSSRSQYRTSSGYFQAGNQNAQDYNFNYRKLFEEERQEKLLNNQQLRLKAEFIKALDDDVEYLNAVLEAKASGSINGLVDRAANKIFKSSLDMFEEIYKQTEAKELQRRKTGRLNFGQLFYDADDLDLMKEMLRLGLERVAQDRCYVLPTLPDVHCMPMLQDWIRCRYGKRYTQAERKKSFAESKILMNHLILILGHDFVRAPRQTAVSCSKSPTSTFAAHNENRSEITQFWDQYTKNFTVSLLEIGRIFHYAMRAHQNCKTSSTYYAYMPAHLGDMELSYTKPRCFRRSTKRHSTRDDCYTNYK